MTALIIIAALLIVLCMISVGVSVSFYEGKLSLSVKLCAKQIHILPKEHDKSGKSKKAEKPAKKKKPKRLPFSFNDYVSIARIALRMLNRLRRRLRFDRIRASFIAASDDPYTTVMQYSTVCAALESLAPAFENVIRVKERDIRVSTDFDAQKPVLGFDFSLSIRIGGLLGVVLLAAGAAAKVYISSVFRQKGMERNGQQA